MLFWEKQKNNKKPACAQTEYLYDSFPSNKINTDIFLGIQICEFTQAFIFS